MWVGEFTTHVSLVWWGLGCSLRAVDPWPLAGNEALSVSKCHQLVPSGGKSWPGHVNDRMVAAASNADALARIWQAHSTYETSPALPKGSRLGVAS